VIWAMSLAQKLKLKIKVNHVRLVYFAFELHSLVAMYSYFDSIMLSHSLGSDRGVGVARSRSFFKRVGFRRALGIVVG